VMSLSLGIMNLLPIPVLDGGHLVYYLAEAIRGKPLSERTLLVAQRLGIAVLGMLTLLAFYNDFHRMLLSH
jgi:regulator of sigma E protease